MGNISKWLRLNEVIGWDPNPIVLVCLSIRRGGDTREFNLSQNTDRKSGMPTQWEGVHGHRVSIWWGREPSSENNPPRTLILDVQALVLWENKPMLFELPSLWYSAITAWEDYLTGCMESPEKTALYIGNKLVLENSSIYPPTNDWKAGFEWTALISN